MKKITVLAAGLLFLLSSLAFSDSFSFRVGYFLPGSSTNLTANPNSLWAIELDQMSFRKTDFNGWTFGGAYDYFLGKNLNLSFAVDYYNKNRTGYYNDWLLNSLTEGDFAFPFDLFEGTDILHSFNVTSTPLMFSLKFLPLGRRARLIPFIGGGATLNVWRVRLVGDTVNFADPWIYTDPVLGDIDIYPVEFANGRESGATFGWHAFGGFQFPVGYRTTIEAEVRYHAAKARFKEWFVGFDDFDLGGLAVTFGLTYWF
jgi:hypothetical protein